MYQVHTSINFTITWTRNKFEIGEPLIVLFPFIVILIQLLFQFKNVNSHCVKIVQILSFFFLVRIFPHSDWIGRDTSYLSLFGPSAGKYGPDETPYLVLFTPYLVLFTQCVELSIFLLFGIFRKLFKGKTEKNCEFLTHPKNEVLVRKQLSVEH